MDAPQRLDSPEGDCSGHPHLSFCQETMDSSIRSHCHLPTGCSKVPGLVSPWLRYVLVPLSVDSWPQDILPPISHPLRRDRGCNLLSSLRVPGRVFCIAASAQQTPEVGWSQVPPSVSQAVQGSKVEECSSHKPKTHTDTLAHEEHVTVLCTNRCRGRNKVTSTISSCQQRKHNKIVLCVQKGQ